MVVVGGAEIEIHDAVDLTQGVGVLMTVSQFCGKVKQIGCNGVRDFLFRHIIDSKVKSTLININISIICPELIISFSVVILAILIRAGNIAQLQQLLPLQFEATIAVIGDIIIIV